MDAVCGDEPHQLVVVEELLPHRDQGQVFGIGQLGHRIGVHLLMPVDHLHVPQPVHDPLLPQSVPADEGQIPGGVNGRQTHEHRLDALLPQHGHRVTELLPKGRQLCPGMMIPRRVCVDGRPVVVTVVAAVGHQCIVGLQPPVQIVLHQRLALGDGGSHFGAVHHLRPALRIALQYLVVMEMIVIPLIRHGGLQ